MGPHCTRRRKNILETPSEVETPVFGSKLRTKILAGSYQLRHFDTAIVLLTGTIQLMYGSSK